MTDLDTFLDAYIECALWSSTDDDGDPIDDTHGPGDIAPQTLATMREECEGFIGVAGDLLTGLDDAQCGHDFWLTRNGHGTGFWDRGYPGDLGDRLSKTAKAFGSVDLYIADGMVHQ